MLKSLRAFILVSIFFALVLGGSLSVSAEVNSSTTGDTVGVTASTCGDVNGDGKIDAIDFAVLKQHLLGIQVNINLQAADVDEDTTVGALDLAVIKQYLLKMIDKLPYHENTDDITIEPNGSITLQQAIDSVKAGNTIYMKSGTYKYSQTIIIKEGNNGSSGSLKNIVASGSVTLDFSGMSYSSSNRGIVAAGNYWNIKCLKIQKAGDNGMLLSGNNNTIDNCEFYANRDSGLQISRYNSSYTSINQWPSNNIIKDCYSHSNYDPDNGEDADGFSPKLTCGKGNKFYRCISKYNVDDGYDLYTKDETGPIGSLYFEDCEASYNGKTEDGVSTPDSDGNGFKLGGDKISVDHTLVRCKAFNNKKHGFTWNSNPGKLSLTGCQASGNGGNDFEKVVNN